MALGRFGLSLSVMYADSWLVRNPAATDLAALIFIPLALTFLWSLLALANLAACACATVVKLLARTEPAMIRAHPVLICLHPALIPVETVLGERVAWLCPDCDAQLDPGARSTELSPDTSWPAVRRTVR